MQHRRRADIQSRTRLLDDFFKVDEYIVSYEGYGGEMIDYHRRLNFERGDAVAVLLFNVDTRSVVLVEQFKLPTLIARRRDDPAIQDGWITETMAGMIGLNETPEDAAIRETLEETGYKIESLEFICKFLSSPGGTSERIFLYCASVRNSRRPGGKGTFDDDASGAVGDESIKVFEVSVNSLFDQLTKGEIDDPKLAIAAYWLKDKIPIFERLDPDTYRYAIKGKPGLIVGYKTGDISYVKGIDAWVNGEYTDMLMDGLFGKSVSSKVRYRGAQKDENGVIEDTIQESLRNVSRRRERVKVGAVLVTDSGMLRSTHHVQRIFHVAVAERGLDLGVKIDPHVLKTCVENILARVGQENNGVWARLSKRRPETILIPILGADYGEPSVEVVAAELISAAINYFRSEPSPALKQIYFLVPHLREKVACDNVFNMYQETGVLLRCAE